MGLKRVPDVKIQRILWLGVFIAPLTMGWILTQIIEKPEGLVTASLSLTRSSIIPDFKDIFFYFALFQLFAAFSIPKIIRAKAKMLQGLADASAQVQGMN
ncbi:MAG: hypothetical protein KDD52_09860, partial [Bdellovibrionales bacterium]|nr:hypothetical protein [Bdellovibrionales bacterium]